MLNYFRFNQNYLNTIDSLERDLIKSNARIEELTSLCNRQADTIIDLCVTNSSAELIVNEMESQKTEITKWQNKYIDLVNKSLTKVPSFMEDDRIEADGDINKEPINPRIPWHTRRRQLENQDRLKANELRTAADEALKSKPPSIEVLKQAAQELEDEFVAGDKL